MNRTPIEWTHWSVNAFKMRMPDGTLINVCIHKSDGCRNCYAEMIVRRWWKKEWGAFPGYTAALLKLGTPVLVEAELEAVLRLNERIAKGKADPEVNRVFWHDMTDEFLEFWPDEFIDKCFAVRALTPNLIHQVLTKRVDRMREYWQRFSDNETHFSAAGCWASEMAHALIGSGLCKPETDESDDGSDWVYESLLTAAREGLTMIHAGTSVENQKTADERIPLLLETPAAVRWISAEPLLGPIEFSDVTNRSDAVRRLGKGSLDGIHWIVCGGESGSKARPMHPDWARSLRDQCVATDVPFFFKQWGQLEPIGIVNDGDEVVNGTAVYDQEGERISPDCCSNDYEVDPEQVAVRFKPVGKKVAGRLLDGIEWNQYPQAQAKAVSA